MRLVQKRLKKKEIAKQSFCVQTLIKLNKNTNNFVLLLVHLLQFCVQFEGIPLTIKQSTNKTRMLRLFVCLIVTI